MELGKAFRAVTALQQERLPAHDARQIGGQVARFAGEDERRIRAQSIGGRGQCGRVGVMGKLARLVRRPAVRGPIGGHGEGFRRR